MQHKRIGALATHSPLSSARRAISHGRPRFGPDHQTPSPSASHQRSRTASHSTATGHSRDAFNAVPPPTHRVEAPSYLYRPFMGHSTRFAAMQPPLSRVGITRLEREPLTHVAPGRVNDHVCIAMVRTLRWIADRAFRERYIHRATMLVTVAAAAPAAGSVAAYLRMFFKRRSTSGSDGARVTKTRSSVAAEVASPFLPTEDSGAANRSSGASASSLQQHGGGSGGRLHRSSTPYSPVSGAALRHSYADELRGLLAQSESHAVHYQILAGMAEITALERGLVLLLQAFHFVVYFALFLFYPRMGFRLMAYTAEESSVVWTQMVNDIDLGKIAELHVPKLALQYWGLEGTFVAQGALVPMVVPPKPQEVVLYRTEEKATAAPTVRDAAQSVAEPTAKSAEPMAAAAHTMNAASSGSAGTTLPHRDLDAEGAKVPAAASPSESASETVDSAAAPKKEEEGAAVEEAARSPMSGDPSEMVFTLRDVVLLIRADEMGYRDVNHEMASELDTQPGFLRRLANRYEQR